MSQNEIIVPVSKRVAVLTYFIRNDHDCFMLQIQNEKSFYNSDLLEVCN